MAMFPATFFKFSTKYPSSGTRLQLGRSYQFAAPPQSPDQRIFALSLQGMCYFSYGAGVIDELTEPGRNMAVLETFYNEHKMAFQFEFIHPVYGLKNCRFNSPLQIPEGITGGYGILPDFDVELVELP